MRNAQPCAPPLSGVLPVGLGATYTGMTDVCVRTIGIGYAVGEDNKTVDTIVINANRNRFVCAESVA